MSEAYDELALRRPSLTSQETQVSYLQRPKLITFGGDHSLMLPALRALKKTYKQPIAVLHFDAHLDTWHPEKYPSAWLDKHIPGDPYPQSYFNHGSMLWLAGQEALIANGSSVHAGLRTRLSGNDFGDFNEDALQGFAQISTDDVDDIGVRGIVDAIMTRIGTEIPLYLSIDIDVIDPGLAPGTGTPEPGGWTTRELLRILRGIEGLNFVGADIVEVSPAYDAGETTALAAAQIAYEVLTNMVLRGVSEKTKSRKLGEIDTTAKDEL